MNDIRSVPDHEPAPRHPTLPGTMLLGAGLGAASLGLAKGLVAWLSGSWSGVTDPDTLIRFARLRETIEAGLPVYGLPRGNLGDGLSIHWSFFLEWLALPFVLLIRPILGLDQALLTVAALIGPVSSGLLAAAVTWAVLPLAPNGRIALAAAVLVGFAPHVSGYGGLGVGDHHVLLVTFVAIACGALLRMGLGRPGAGLLGASLALGAWLSVESLGFALAAAAVPWVLWLIEADAGRRGALRQSLTAGFAIATAGMLGILAIDPPNGDPLALVFDRLALPHAAMMGLLTVFSASMAAFDAKGITSRLAGAGTVGLLMMAVWLIAFFSALGTVDELLSVLSADPGAVSSAGAAGGSRFPWERVRELEASAWDSALSQVAMGPPLVGPILAGLFLWRDPTHRPAVAATLAVAALWLGAGLLYVRFSAYAEAAGIAGALIVADRLYGWQTWSPGRRRLAGTGFFVLFIYLQVGLSALLSATDSTPAGADGASLPGFANPCREPGWPLLVGRRDARLLAHINESPAILFHARGVTVVGALYHRGTAGLTAYLSTWQAPVEDARLALQRFAVDGILACPSKTPAPAEPLPGMTLGDFLFSGGLPDWLAQETPFAGPRQPMLFSVKGAVDGGHGR